MSIGNDWMVYPMVTYIRKTIAKALDISDIIKNFAGILIRRVQISQ